MSELLSSIEIATEREDQDNKRHKVSLGPIEDPPHIPSAGLLYRQLTLDSDADHRQTSATTVSDEYTDAISSQACFGAGCYWGTEHFFKHDFGVKYYVGSGKVLSGEVGFMGPFTAKSNPSYPEVKTGKTDHVEVYDFQYEGGEAAYENLVKHFFSFHDPTTMNHQGHDEGTQYASTIYCYDAKQTEIATRVKAELQSLLDSGAEVSKYTGREVVTAIKDATIFFPAHLAHQAYLDKNPDGECNHFYRFKTWPERKKEETA